MGLLNSVLGAVQGASSTQGGGNAALITALLGLLTQGSQGQGLNLGSLLQQLQQGGLANQVASWVSTGTNQAVSADQLQGALGSAQLGQLAQALGLDSSSAAHQLSQLLPQAVDALTPNGQLPAEGADLGGLASQVMGKFFG